MIVAFMVRFFRCWFWLFCFFSFFPTQVIASTFEFSFSDNRDVLLPKVQSALKSYRNSLKNADFTPSLSNRARGEKNIIESVLRSEGFYQGSVTFKIKDEEVNYLIDAGKAYSIQHIGIKAQEGVELPSEKEIPLKIQQRLRAEEVLLAKSVIEKFIATKNCLYEVKVNYTVEVNQALLEADVRFTVAASEAVSYGEITFSRLRNLDEDYLKNLINIPQQGCFNRNVIDNKVLQLFQTNLFSLVEAEISQPVDGKVDINFAVKERNLRTIKTGLGYNSDLGATLSLGWEHRNLLKRAEKLELSMKLSNSTKEFGGRLTIPAFLSSQRQSLVLDGKLERENTDAFSSRALETSATFNRVLIPKLVGSVGSRYRRVTVKSNDDEDDFALLGLPISLEFDGRNDPLNPIRGELIGIKTEPLIDTLNTDTQFLKSTLRATTYQTARHLTFQPSLAARFKLGTITGDKTQSVPADERFYSGGGGSVRGYSFQSLGPRTDNDPSGGRSVIEMSAETRFRFNESWGGVLFGDGGNVFEADWPYDWQDLSWAWGFGIRYFTSFAPIRFDIGFPINPRDDLDDKYQFYISLGQAF